MARRSKSKETPEGQRNKVPGSTMTTPRSMDGPRLPGEPRYEGTKVSRSAKRHAARKWYYDHNNTWEYESFDTNKVYAPLIIGTEWPPAEKVNSRATSSPAMSASPKGTSSPNTSFEVSTPPDSSGKEAVEDEQQPSWDTYVRMKGDFIPRKTPQQLAQDEVNLRVGKIWPFNVEKCVTLGLFTESGTPFTNPMHAQTRSTLFGILEDDIIGRVLFDFLTINHGTLANLALSCRKGHGMVRKYMCYWDMESALFDNCNNSVPEVDAVIEQHQGNMPFQRPIHVIVARVRIPGRKQGLSRAGPVPQIKALHQMCIATSNWCHQIRTFQLHRVQFLTTDVLRLLVPQLTHLEVFGVFKCPLIHLAKGFELLEIIQIDRPKGKENQVGLDFYPNFHVGPNLTRNAQWTGSYGVTWDDTQFDSRLGIWALVRRMIQRARSQGQDFESPGTAFRKWLDDGPCWYVNDTLRAMMDPYYINAEREITGLMAIAPVLRTKQVEKELAENQKIVAELGALFDAGNMDYDGTGTAETFKGQIGNRFHSWKLFTETGNCGICLSPLLKVFFRYPYRPGNEYGNPAVCYGCELMGWLDAEGDHMKSAKRSVIRHWLCTPGPNGTWGPWNDNDLPRALRDFTKRDVIGAVYNMVQLPMNQAIAHTRVPLYHPEWNEIQVVTDPGGQMYANRNQAPQISHKDKPKGRWDIADTTRRRAHGF